MQNLSTNVSYPADSPIKNKSGKPILLHKCGKMVSVGVFGIECDTANLAGVIIATGLPACKSYIHIPIGSYATIYGFVYSNPGETIIRLNTGASFPPGYKYYGSYTYMTD